MTRKIAVIGSSTFPLTTPVGAQVVDVMRAYGPEAVFLTRNATSPFEKFVANVALAIGNRCLSYQASGGGDNYVRDGHLATDCDEMIAFVDPRALDAPQRGTAMVIERALSAGKPVRAATVVQGNLVWAER